jgi:hypothetical protein
MMKNIFLQQKKAKMWKGFILPFTMLITTIVLFITTSSMTLLSKQMYFSRLYKQSQIAYYAADDAMACTVMIDDLYVGDDGLGIFPSDKDLSLTGVTSYMDGVLTQLKYRDPVFSSVSSLTDIRCAQALIFDTASTSKFTVNPNYIYRYTDPVSYLPATEEGKSISYFMKMPIDATTYRCAKITVNKTPSFRQIISQGYANCDTNGGAVERAVVNETVAQ